MKKKIFYFSIFLVFKALCVNELQIISGIEEFLCSQQSLPKTERFSGAILLAKKGRIIFRKANGNAAFTGEVPNNLNTKFYLGAVGDVFTSTAIYQLAQKKRIALDDPISKYLNCRWGSSKAFKEITILQLLTHTSGFGNLSLNTRYSKISDFQKLIQKEKLHFYPGCSQKYSNIGYILLAAIIEEVSQESYCSYLRKNIFDKAGMHNTGFYMSEKSHTNEAYGYLCNGTSLQQFNYGLNSLSAFSTVLDMFYFSQFLQTEQLNAFLLNVATKPSAHRINCAKGNWNPFGLKIWKSPDVAGLMGSSSGANAFLGIFLKEGYTLVLFANVSNGQDVHLLKKVYQLLGYSLPNYNF
ncbi:MAG: serine hydrolase domain-containing protein [Chlamydiota bacterium]|jgi:CubicO group peptidase (beta-lactamase class C family)